MIHAVDDPNPMHGPYNMKERRALRPRRQQFDRVTLTLDPHVDRDALASNVITELTVRTVPRFKDSPLSGSEWRVSGEVAAFHKSGEVQSVHDGDYVCRTNAADALSELYRCSVFDPYLSEWDLDCEHLVKIVFWTRNVAAVSSTAMSMRKAIAEAYRVRHRCFEFPAVWTTDPSDEEKRCDQEGCTADATHTYDVKKSYCVCCASAEPYPSREIRKFCSTHKNRGTQGYDDSMSNYEERYAAPAD